MIAPRRTRLLCVPDLHRFRQAIRECLRQSASAAVVVPTRSAARQLGTGLTRDELYGEFRVRLAGAPRQLSAIERDVIAQASARAVADAGAPLAFQLRPGLIAEMLRFYDHLRRHSQTVTRFESLMMDALGDGEADVGAARLRQQTRFLAGTFREYERRVCASNACDEHLLRDRLVQDAAADPLRHVIVTVPDWIADDHGLFVADFDLLSRIPGLETIDIVATEGVLRSGFRERLDRWLPGIEETSPYADGDPEIGKPRLMTPGGGDLWFTYRDREEELIAVARTLDEARAAVVYKRPLPYLYLAAEVFRDATVPYQVFDALPLAAEPTAAAFDLILDATQSEFTRDSLVALLRCPQLQFGVDREEVSRFDRQLSAHRYLGGLERLEGLAWADPAYEAAVALARTLAPLHSPRRASQQIGALVSFWTAQARPLANDDQFAPRERRSRDGIIGALETLARTHAGQDDPSWTIDDLALAVRRAIEDQTFVPDSPAAGVHLLDDRAAPYGDFEDVFVVGLIENDWPEKPRRNVFYPPALLSALGWPAEKDRLAAATAQFIDLMSSASRRTCVSSFTLDDDVLVSRSMQLDEIPRAQLSSVTRAPLEEPSSFGTERHPARHDAGIPRTQASDDPAFHGQIGEQAARAWSVSALETYLGCPFRFLAQHILKLVEEPEDEEVLDPRHQGQLVHRVFEDFFNEWQSAGYGTITAANLETARELFAQVVDRAVKTLPAAEAGLERTRLLGSPAAAGLGEAVFRMEAERPTRVVERLLEHRLEGTFTIATNAGVRDVALKGKADRIDLLEDGTFRLIDYKLGWPPDRKRSLQLPIYSICAEQRLTSHRGRPWRLGEAAYLAFKGPRRVVPLFAAGARDKVLAEAQQRLADTVSAIERGAFPPTPDDVFRCDACAYASVCRKDYVGDV